MFAEHLVEGRHGDRVAAAHRSHGGEPVRIPGARLDRDERGQAVYQRFGELRGQSDQRRLRLVLAVSRETWRRGAPVPRRDLATLTPQLARDYATKTDKTLTRDLNAIAQLGLLRREKAGLSPADDAILGLRQGFRGVLSD